MPADPEVLRERLRKAREAKAAKAATIVAEPDLDSDDDDVLGQLAATILKARDKKANQRKILLDLAEILDKIDPKEHPELAEDPTIEAFVERISDMRVKKAQEEGLPPGTVIGNPNSLSATIVPWTEADLTHPKWGCLKEDGTPNYVTFTPNETIPVWYNGIRCQFIADEEITVLKCFYDVYQEHKRQSREGDQRKAYMFGKSNTLPGGDMGEGAVAMARVRAFMGMGGEGGGGRMLIGYPGDARFELRDVPGAGAVAGTESVESAT